MNKFSKWHGLGLGKRKIFHVPSPGLEQNRIFPSGMAQDLGKEKFSMYLAQDLTKTDFSKQHGLGLGNSKFSMYLAQDLAQNNFSKYMAQKLAKSKSFQVRPRKWSKAKVYGYKLQHIPVQIVSISQNCQQKTLVLEIYSQYQI